MKTTDLNSNARNAVVLKTISFVTYQYVGINSTLLSHGRGHWFDPSTAHQNNTDLSVTCTRSGACPETLGSNWGVTWLLPNSSPVQGTSVDRGRGSRREYHRAYYARTAARRRKLSGDRQKAKRWAAWLLANLEWPAEVEIVVPRSPPLRRPVLRLPRKR